MNARARRTLLLLLITTSGATSATQIAWADAKSDALVKEGMTLSEAGKHVDACPKFAEAVKIDPALNTQMNLAECYEKIQKPASAYSTWITAEQIAKTTGRTKEEARAHERAQALEPTVPKLKIVLPPGSKDAVVKVDGKKITIEGLASVPVDAGEHAVDVTLAGKKPWHDDVHVQLGTALVEVPPFKDPEPEKPAALKDLPHWAAMRPSRGFRIAGAAIAGVGAVGLAIGIVSGTSAIRSRDDARAACADEDPKKCRNEAGMQLWRDAQSAGNLSTIAFVAGGALVAAGAIVWIIAPDRPVVSGSIDPNGGARINVAGKF